MDKLTSRLHLLCSSLSSKHTTFMQFTHQSIVILFESLSQPTGRGSAKTRVTSLMLAIFRSSGCFFLTLKYVLDGLADDAIAQHIARGSARLADPFPDVIMAVNEWLHWNHLARTPEPTLTCWYVTSKYNQHDGN